MPETDKGRNSEDASENNDHKVGIGTRKPFRWLAFGENLSRDELIDLTNKINWTASANFYLASLVSVAQGIANYKGFTASADFLTKVNRQLFNFTPLIRSYLRERGTNPDSSDNTRAQTSAKISNIFSTLAMGSAGAVMIGAISSKWIPKSLQFYAIPGFNISNIFSNFGAHFYNQADKVATDSNINEIATHLTSLTHLSPHAADAIAKASIAHKTDRDTNAVSVALHLSTAASLAGVVGSGMTGLKTVYGTSATQPTLYDRLAKLIGSEAKLQKYAKAGSMINGALFTLPWVVHAVLQNENSKGADKRLPHRLDAEADKLNSRGWIELSGIALAGIGLAYAMRKGKVSVSNLLSDTVGEGSPTLHKLASIFIPKADMLSATVAGTAMLAMHESLMSTATFSRSFWPGPRRAKQKDAIEYIRYMHLPPAEYAAKLKELADRVRKLKGMEDVTIPDREFLEKTWYIKVAQEDGSIKRVIVDDPTKHPDARPVWAAASNVRLMLDLKNEVVKSGIPEAHITGEHVRKYVEQRQKRLSGTTVIPESIMHFDDPDGPRLSYSYQSPLVSKKPSATSVILPPFSSWVETAKPLREQNSQSFERNLL